MESRDPLYRRDDPMGPPPGDSWHADMVDAFKKQAARQVLLDAVEERAAKAAAKVAAKAAEKAAPEEKPAAAAPLSIRTVNSAPRPRRGR